MRRRNIKINVYLNEAEKKMLEEKSSKSKLSNKLNRLCYYDFVAFLNEQIFNIKNTINQIKKNVEKLEKDNTINTSIVFQLYMYHFRIFLISLSMIHLISSMDLSMLKRPFPTG